MKVEKAVLVGHSFGGIVTAHLAATKSDVITAAVLIGPVLPNPSLEQVFRTRAQTVDKGMAWQGSDRLLSFAAGQPPKSGVQKF